MQMVKPAAQRRIGQRPGVRRCYVSQSNECKDDDDHFILPSSSIMQPVVSDPLCGRFPDTTLGLCNEKLLLSPCNYPYSY